MIKSLIPLARCLLALVPFLVAGCSGPGGKGNTPSGPGRAAVAAEGDTVTVHYTGTLKDGTVFDSSRGKAPFTFRLGAAEAVPGFDAAVRGMAVGDKKHFELPPEQAYGQRSDKMVATYARAQFGALADKIKKGDRLQMNMASGRTVPVLVTDATADSVTVDANHELAGKTLIFDIELVKLEKR